MGSRRALAFLSPTFGNKFTSRVVQICVPSSRTGDGPVCRSHRGEQCLPLLHFGKSHQEEGEKKPVGKTLQHPRACSGEALHRRCNRSNEVDLHRAGGVEVLQPLVFNGQEGWRGKHTALLSPPAARRARPVRTTGLWLQPPCRSGSTSTTTCSSTSCFS